MIKKYFVYIMQSEKDGRYYKGLTSDISNRVKEHNAGKMKSTKGYLPWKLKYHEELDTLKEARVREKYFKSGIGREFINNILHP